MEQSSVIEFSKNRFKEHIEIVNTSTHAKITLNKKVIFEMTGEACDQVLNAVLISLNTGFDIGREVGVLIAKSVEHHVQ